MARERSRSPTKTSRNSIACSLTPVSFRGRQAVCIANDIISLTVYCGGGHLALLQFVGETAGADEDFGSPLWVPPWSTFDPAVVAVVPSNEFGESAEGTRLLPHIAGHSLCVDVFGNHSAGEEKHACLGLHGEAGQVTWVVSSSSVSSDGSQAELTMTAHLRHTALEVSRTFGIRCGDSTVSVKERVKNLVGFERVFGRANHVTLGAAFLRDGKTTVTANVTRGKTFPEVLSPLSTFAVDREFDYPNLPSASSESLDWRHYPRTISNLDLCSCLVDTTSDYGWMCAHNRKRGVALCYVWERKAFPWLTNWEENFATEELPWSGRTLTRGLEFSSYAFPTSRQQNVRKQELFGVPCFEWLDAYAEKCDRFWLALHRAKEYQEPLELRQSINTSNGSVTIESDAGFKLCP